MKSIDIICTHNNSRIGQVEHAVRTLNGVQNYYFFSLDKSASSDVSDALLVDWKTFCAAQPKYAEGYSIYITEKPFDDNWFSHEASHYSIISTYGWERLFSPPSLKAYLMYQIAQAAICFEADFTEEMESTLLHFDTVGCMFDFCEHKPDLKLGMTAGTICPNCRATLRRYGVLEDAIASIERILDCVRAETIGRPVAFLPNRAFIVMRFSVHDENDHAYLYGIQPALRELGIECFRGDHDVMPAHILENIQRDIQRSRFVIAKIDENNLNVYFELGLSMGLHKDVLLISEETLILRLPADLRGWNCLTYPKGNYEQLKENVVAHFRRHYHY